MGPRLRDGSLHAFALPMIPMIPPVRMRVSAPYIKVLPRDQPLVPKPLDHAPDLGVKQAKGIPAPCPNLRVILPWGVALQRVLN
jgi:hypothetical protein